MHVKFLRLLPLLVVGLVLVGMIRRNDTASGNTAIDDSAAISETGFSCALDERPFPAPDRVKLTNRTGQRLVNSRFLIRLIGIQGEISEIPIFLSIWETGEPMEFLIRPQHSVLDVQQIEIAGESAQGPIKGAWSFKGGRRNVARR